MPWWWPFGKKKEENKPQKASVSSRNMEAYMEQYFKQQKAEVEAAINRGISKKQLQREAQSKALEFGRMGTTKEAIQAVVLDRIAAELISGEFERNMEGEKAEKEGRIEDAIVFYEANVRDQFEGSFPYERLRVIYRKRKQFDQAIRVCEAAVKNPYCDERTKAKMQEWADKMKAGQ